MIDFLFILFLPLFNWIQRIHVLFLFIRDKFRFRSLFVLNWTGKREQRIRNPGHKNDFIIISCMTFGFVDINDYSMNRWIYSVEPSFHRHMPIRCGRCRCRSIQWKFLFRIYFVFFSRFSYENRRQSIKNRLHSIRKTDTIYWAPRFGFAQYIFKNGQKRTYFQLEEPQRLITLRRTGNHSNLLEMHSS